MIVLEREQGRFASLLSGIECINCGERSNGLIYFELGRMRGNPIELRKVIL